jgi:hypothetical protein
LGPNIFLSNTKDSGAKGCKHSLNSICY